MKASNKKYYGSADRNCLSGILYKATGMFTVDYANKYLFEPLGIPGGNISSVAFNQFFTIFYADFCVEAASVIFYSAGRNKKLVANFFV